MSNKQRVIPVIGMHRSGTSVVTRGLMALGVSLGDGPMGVGYDNPKGFWEDLDIVDINERLLKEFGMTWHSVKLIESHDWEKSKVKHLKLEAIELIRKRFGKYPIWCFKDPRVARLLPFWKSIFAHLGIDDSYIIVIRNPLSVAKSLNVRNGFRSDKSHLLWLEHYISAISNIYDRPHIIVDYDNIMAKPVQQFQQIAERLDIPLNASIQEALSRYINDYITLELRHTVFLPEDLDLDESLPELTKRLYGMLRELPNGCLSPNESKEVEAIDNSLRSLKPIFHYLDESYTVEGQKQDLERRLKEEIESHESIVKGLNEKIEELSKNNSFLEGQKQDLERRLKEEIESHESIVKGLNENMEELSKNNSFLEGQKQDLERRLKEEIESHESVVKGLNENMEELSKNNSFLEGQKQDLERRLKEEIESHESIVKGLNENMEELSKNNSFLEGQKQDLERRLEAILSSKTWKLGQLYGKIFGVESPVRRGIKGLFNKGDGLSVRTSDSNHLVKEQEKPSPVQLLMKELRGTKTNKYDVICFPIIDWFFRFQRPQQILTQFATNGSRVFYINPKFLNESEAYFNFTKIRENIYDISIIADTSLSIYRDNISKGNLDKMMKSLTALRREAGIIEAVCFVQLPFWQPLAKRIKDEFGWKIIYDCMDDHSGFSTNEASMVSNEERLATECDLLITASNSLYEKMKKNNEKCILIPNAADFDHFKHLPPNDLLREIKKPIIGYYGAISDWFDNELVEFLAESRKNWSFVFIGHTFGSDISRLKKMNNVYFLGEKPYSELPKYLYWFDVCIIPFRLNNLIKATNPVKFYEFISSGKKVVSVEMPELLPYSEYLYIARDRNEFLIKIEEALKENNYDLITKRIELAKSHTWEKRFEVLSSEIKRLFPKVSIIIVTYNNLNHTKLCIESILTKTQYPNFNIIIVDNNSTDGTKEYLKELCAKNLSITVILNKENMGFAKANNQGIAVSDKSDYIVFLNNDTIVTRGWLSKLLKHLEDNTVGMVGPVTNFCGNEAKIEVPYKTIEELEDFSESYIRNHIDPESFDIKVLAFFCVALRRQVLDEVGLLDENFGIGMFEDDDYAHRVRLKGYRILCAEDVFIHHFGEASFSKLKESGEYKKIFEENKSYFESKWGTKWEPHRYRWQK